MAEEDLQKKYMEYQFLTEQIKKMHQQVEAAEQQLVEIMATVQSLDEFNKLKEGDEILVPINNGIFAKAKIEKSGKLLVNVGASTIVDRDIESTKAMIEKQKKDILEMRSQIATNVNKMVEKAQSLEKELQELVNE
jgi:prefoldin alpha subunit